MMWDLETVNRVRAAKITSVLPFTLIVEIDDDQTVMEGMFNHLSKTLAKYITREFEVGTHPHDFEITTFDDECEVNGRVITIRWRPRTCEVELCGGEHDGRRVAVERVWEPLLMPVVDGATSPESNVTVLRYELVGWREDERCWVHQLVE